MIKKYMIKFIDSLAKKVDDDNEVYMAVGRLLSAMDTKRTFARYKR